MTSAEDTQWTFSSQAGQLYKYPHSVPLFVQFATGAPLHEILAAGEWRSPAFLEYLDRHALERDMVDQSHMIDVLESDDED